MLFNSLTYLLFITVVVILFWLLSYRLRLLMLFIASITFYAFWRVEFVSLMLLSAFTDYYVSRQIAKTEVLRKRKILLLASLSVNLGLLIYFKYLLFFANSFVSLASILGFSLSSPTWEIILPLGISFYTFQTISYTVDVYRGSVKPVDDFILYGCYVMFFPQLVAGPILRVKEVVFQLQKRPSFNLEYLGDGLTRIFYGLFLKVVLADNIAPFVDNGFNLPVENVSAVDTITLAFLFGFQIYFDFSAYSHIAIGSAKLMGIQFPENFNYPYLSTSFRNFWKNWHISLSSWIRDYLYLPLTGAKVKDHSTGGLNEALSIKKRNQALFVTWAIMGLWHGANWTFLLWGIYHAIFIFIERQFKKYKLFRFKSPVINYVFALPAIMLSWIFFRADNVSDALYMYRSLFIPSNYFSLNMRENVYLITFSLFVCIIMTYVIHRYLAIHLEKRQAINFVANVIVIVVTFVLVFVFLRPVEQFIYFQF